MKDSYISAVQFERPGLVRRLMKAAITNPLANYMPSGMTKAILRFTKSELAAANWADPGGWRSMVISYEGHPRKLADRVLVSSGSMPMALRNRRRLAAKVLAELIDQCERDTVHILCLGAGPGHIVTDAMLLAQRRSHATLVDLSSEAFDYGRKVAAEKGLGDRVRYLQGDVRDVRGMIESPPDVVKMLGICEYLTDEQIVAIVGAVSAVMPEESRILFNSISKSHGTDRFFRRVLGLHMNHRSPQDLMRLVGPAGFGDFVSIPEPLGVYHVVTGRKSAPAGPCGQAGRRASAGTRPARKG
jgi:2-polyprenyl-3-methyl-5-hydroxy-6-metoxy-1,4-benzoquinol methylase